MQLAKGKSMIFGYFLTRAQINLLDCCITFFRVHLYSNHVISMVIFHTGTDTWSPIDINNCNGCLIYFINNLEVLFTTPRSPWCLRYQQDLVLWLQHCLVHCRGDVPSQQHFHPGTPLPCRSRISEYCGRSPFLHGCLSSYNCNCVIFMLFTSNIRYFVENRHILGHRYLHLYTFSHHICWYPRSSIRMEWSQRRPRHSKFSCARYHIRTGNERLS